MSGINQHFVPRFVQDGFVSRGKQDKRLTFVYSKTRGCYEPNLKGSNAERFFYSEEDGLLDTLITDYERDVIVPLWQRLRLASSGVLSEPQIPEMLSHFEVRTKNFREALNNPLKQFFERLSAVHLDVPAVEADLVRRFKQDPDSFFPDIGREERRHLGRILRKIPEHTLRKAARETAESGIPQLKALFELVDIDAASAHGHQRALLSTGPAPQHRQRAYGGLPFSIRIFEEGSLVLGDSVIVVSTTPRKGWAPFLDKDQDVVTVAVPLASDRLLIGGQDPGLSVASWNEIVVQCSREQFQAATRTPELLQLVARIGVTADLLSAKEIDGLIEASFNESMLKPMGIRLAALCRKA